MHDTQSGAPYYAFTPLCGWFSSCSLTNNLDIDIVVNAHVLLLVLIVLLKFIIMLLVLIMLMHVFIIFVNFLKYHIVVHNVVTSAHHVTFLLYSWYYPTHALSYRLKFIGGRRWLVVSLWPKKLHFKYMFIFSQTCVTFCSLFICVDNMFGFVYVRIVSKLEHYFQP